MAQRREMNTRITQRERSTGLKEVSADICVVGAGISGVSTAIEAARLGLKVVLVDGMPALGGQAAHSIIGTFCGLFAHGDHRYQFTHGIADDILRDLGKINALNYRRGPRYTTVMYDEIALSRWIEETVAANGITVIVGAILHSVDRVGKRIHSADFATRYGGLHVAANSFVDATGDAALTWAAGLPCQVPETPIYGSQMIVVEGVDVSAIPSVDEVARRLKVQGANYGLVRRDGFAFAFPQRGTALVNLTHVETPLDPVSVGSTAIEGKAQADRALTFLREEFPDSFRDSRIRAYGFPGIRQTRWIVGSHHLSADELRAGTHFSDAIARTAWPIELHDRLDGHKWEMFSDDHVHYVPFGSLVPPEVDNLVAVGRCIDADADALSSVRVMGPCIAMGAAAAHALQLAGERSVHEVNTDALQERLRDNVSRTD